MEYFIRRTVIVLFSTTILQYTVAGAHILVLRNCYNNKRERERDKNAINVI